MYKPFVFLIFISVSIAIFPRAESTQNFSASFQSKQNDEAVQVHKLADGVYAIIHDNATDQWPHSNVGVVVGAKDVLIIDANYLPSRARADIPIIKSITTKPVRYLVFTHWHMDHNNGTVAYRDSFPGIEIISERETSRFIEINSTWYSKMVAAPSSAKRLSLAALEKQLTSGKDTSGRALTGNEKNDLEKIIHQRKNEIDELSSLEVLMPNKIFDNEMTIDLGRRRVQLKDWGRANSPHDVTIYLPDQKILFAGDILVQTLLPYVSMSWPVPWIKVLGQLERLPVSAIVTGHGPVLKDHSYTKQLRELMETVQAKVIDAPMNKGQVPDVIQRTLNVDELQKGVWRTDEVTSDDWKLIINILTERMIRGVRGQG